MIYAKITALIEGVVGDWDAIVPNLIGVNEGMLHRAPKVEPLVDDKNSGVPAWQLDGSRATRNGNILDGIQLAMK
ncbi:MAG: hypothetical protein GWQ08_13920, partial [Verrucomicrobiaceae bacterium]|nr:hypothetical protein [Verrucomicrobiaceae bacterium]